MHKVELKDEIKDLFGNGTEGEFLRYFTSKFPRLLVHCYNAVEKEARDQLTEYVYQDASAQASTVVIDTSGPRLEGSKMITNCEDDISFPETKFQFDSLIICNSSRLFIEDNKSFSNFLQKNGSNITQLEFFRGTLKFESLKKILQKLPNLMEIQFHGVEYGDSKLVLTATYHYLVLSETWGAESSKLLQEFLECQTKQKLEENHPRVTLEEILQKYPSLEELEVWVDDKYPVRQQHEANARIHQLKVLKIRLETRDAKVQEKVINAILKQNNLQQISFISDNSTNNDFSPSQSLCKKLAAHICQLEHLTILTIDFEKLLEEVEAFAANCRVAWITRLHEFTCRLRHFKSLPLSFLAHFTNLRKLNISCYNAEQTKVEDLISFMDKRQLTSIELCNLPSASFQLLRQLQVDALQMLKIHICNFKDEVPVFDILQEFLPRHPSITKFEIGFRKDNFEPKSLELIPMVLVTLTNLEWLQVENCPKITQRVIEQITALKTLKYWKINGHESETFTKLKTNEVDDLKSRKFLTLLNVFKIKNN